MMDKKKPSPFGKEEGLTLGLFTIRVKNHLPIF